VISEYVDVLAARLSFDRSLSRRVRQEVEDHLREAVAVDPAGSALEAERRAIARFGDPLDMPPSSPRCRWPGRLEEPVSRSFW
jgi:hypothetical protein